MLRECPRPGSDRVKIAVTYQQVNTWAGVKQVCKWCERVIPASNGRSVCHVYILAKRGDGSQLIDCFSLSQRLQRYLIFPFFQSWKYAHTISKSFNAGSDENFLLFSWFFGSTETLGHRGFEYSQNHIGGQC